MKEKKELLRQVSGEDREKGDGYGAIAGTSIFLVWGGMTVCCGTKIGPE